MPHFAAAVLSHVYLLHGYEVITRQIIDFITRQFAVFPRLRRLYPSTSASPRSPAFSAFPDPPFHRRQAPADACCQAHARDGEAPLSSALLRPERAAAGAPRAAARVRLRGGAPKDPYAPATAVRDTIRAAPATESGAGEDPARSSARRRRSAGAAGTARDPPDAETGAGPAPPG